MTALKASRPATEVVNEPRAIDPAGELELREAYHTSTNIQTDASRRLIGGTGRWSTAVPQTALAHALLKALARRAGGP